MKIPIPELQIEFASDLSGSFYKLVHSAIQVQVSYKHLRIRKVIIQQEVAFKAFVGLFEALMTK